MKTSNILTTTPSEGYELLDSGEGEKLERFGRFTLSRPDPQALWRKKLSASEWKKADGAFGAEWTIKKDMPGKWPIEFGGLKFYVKPTAFKHTGLFPEQALNWDWLRDKIQNATKVCSESAGGGACVDFAKQTKTHAPSRKDSGVDNSVEVLNLFGYTGGATLTCAQAGAKVVHVDGSKAAIAWARENAELSGLEKKPVRWILDDARAFVKREIKRERKYGGIIMDPPAFGHGPDNELWKIEEHFLSLVEDCFKALKDQPLFFLINGYSAGYSAIAYENILRPLKEKFGGNIEIGELAIQESQATARVSTDNVADTSRLLPCGIFARWSAGV